MANTELTLQGAEDLLCETMQAATTMYNQLDSEDFQKRYEAKNGRGAYQDWRARAITAYEFKTKEAKEIQAYIKAKFGLSYKTLTEVQLAIKERGLAAPDWMSSEESNGTGKATETQLALPIQEESPKKAEEIQLSLQSNKLLAGILERLRTVRLERKMSQVEAAQYFGVGGQALGDWERGHTPVTLINVFRLAALYEVDPVWVLTGKMMANQQDLELVAKHLEMNVAALKNLIEDES